ncbi:hypothetical protein BG003_009477, partial [Podila horticola]
MPVYSPSGQMITNRNESILYFFTYYDVQAYNIHTATWSAKIEPTGQRGIEKSLMLDTDEDRIYGLGRLPSTGWGSKEQWSLRVFDPDEMTLAIVANIPAEIATGDIPESRGLSCITSAYGGKKLVVASGA